MECRLQVSPQALLENTLFIMVTHWHCPALLTASAAKYLEVRCGKLSSNHLQLKGKLTAKS